MVFEASIVLASIDAVLDSSLEIVEITVSIETVGLGITGLDGIELGGMVLSGRFAKISSTGKGRKANKRKIHISSACIGVLASLTPSRACTTIS